MLSVTECEEMGESLWSYLFFKSQTELINRYNVFLIQAVMLSLRSFRSVKALVREDICQRWLLVLGVFWLQNELPGVSVESRSARGNREQWKVVGREPRVLAEHPGEPDAFLSLFLVQWILRAVFTFQLKRPGWLALVDTTPFCAVDSKHYIAKQNEYYFCRCLRPLSWSTRNWQLIHLCIYSFIFIYTFIHLFIYHVNLFI